MTSRNGPVAGARPDGGEHSPGDVLIRIHDLAGRPRGLGFPADHRGTLITSHEAVDGLPRLVLHGPDDRHRVVSADAVTPLPELGLALVRCEGLGTAPLPVATRNRVESGTCADRRRVLARGTRPGSDPRDVHGHRPLPPPRRRAGTRHRHHGPRRPAPRRRSGRRPGARRRHRSRARRPRHGPPLRRPRRRLRRAAGPRPGPLAELLAENAATVPAYGADLNVAGVLELTATSVAQDGPSGALAPGGVAPVERAATAAEFAAFERGRAAVLGLVGPPGSGRTTELAGLAARRHRAGLPTLWLRGADLRDDDLSVANAAHRALDRAARIVAASRTPFPGGPEGLGDTGPGASPRWPAPPAAPAGPARRPGGDAARPGRPPRPVDRRDGALAAADGRAAGGGCRAEYWESAGALLPADLLHRSGTEAGTGVSTVDLVDPVRPVSTGTGTRTKPPPKTSPPVCASVT
ncbi:hypothetical protein ACR6C2_33350 [Streptomyces sp. INA 01156]